MKTISIINLKGGVGKTITAINMAHILATTFGKKVLLVDNDKQGNATKFLGLHSYSVPSLSEVILKFRSIDETIRQTAYQGLDLLPANMTLLQANSQLGSKMSMNSLTVLKNAFGNISSNYDYCIIDNPPDINPSVINALNASDEIIVPIVMDQFSFDGFDQLEEQFEDAKQLNSKLTFKGCLVTRFGRGEKEFLTDEVRSKYKMFNTIIRRTDKVSGSTFANMPILEYSNRCGAAKDYQKFVREYFNF